MKPVHVITRSTLMLALSLLTACGDDLMCPKGQGNVETRTFQLDAFDGVKVNGSSEVYISYGAQQLVEVKAEPNVLDAIRRDVSDGIWVVGTDRCFRRHKTIEVYITLPALSYVEVNGSGEIVVHDTFETDEFTTMVDGSGEINANFVAKRAITQISGSGKAELGGSAEQQNVSISGSGKAHTFALDTQRAIVTISGSGDAEVSVSDVLEANISGSGKVYYEGSPTVNSQISGSGKVVKR